MGSDIRESKTCQNCEAFVEKDYCPKCGQKNTESRESFIHLFTHFISDFVHYDGSFWTTVRYLMFKPGKLSLNYMNGRRKSYLNPFSLYIFISFLTFLTPSILPSDKAEHTEDKKNLKYFINDSTLVTVHLVNDVPKTDTIKIKDLTVSQGPIKASIGLDSIKIKEYTIAKYGFAGRKLSQLDSLQKALPDNRKMSFWEYNGHKYSLILSRAINDGSLLDERGIDYAARNFPKVLIFFMPIFAFWLWLFNCNKKRNYFDSGIFTLHFFSFWLFLSCIFLVLSHFTELFGLDGLTFLLFMGMMTWISIYFYKAMRTFYGDTKFATFLKGTLLVMINTVCMLLVLSAFILYVVFHFISYQ